MTDLAPRHSAPLLLLFAVLLPPVAVHLKTRDWLHTIIWVILTCLLWLPGFLHSLFFVVRRSSNS